MIQYALRCSKGHTFDSWFKSADAFDRLLTANMVSCSVCGGTDVQKAIMTPRVQSRQNTKEPTLREPAGPAEQALAEMRRQVEENSTYVGGKFAEEARAQHDGDMPERAIYGEARPDEARKLIEDGVPVAPLPFLPARKSN